MRQPDLGIPDLDERKHGKALAIGDREGEERKDTRKTRVRAQVHSEGHGMLCGGELLLFLVRLYLVGTRECYGGGEREMKEGREGERGMDKTDTHTHTQAHTHTRQVEKMQKETIRKKDG